MLTREPVKTTNLFNTLSSSTKKTSTHSRSTASSSTTSGDTTPTAAVDKKKKKKKKKSDATGKVVENDKNGDREITARKENGTGTNETAYSNGPDPSQLPLQKRLEIAASHADIHAALVGLLGWSRLYVNSDEILAFFQGDALELLLVNIFETCPTTDVIYDNLNALLTNCLSCEQHGKSGTANTEIANAVVASTRSIVDKLRASKQDRVVSIKKVAQYLSKLVLHYRLSLNGVEVGSSLAQDILQIDSELATAATKDGAVQGQSIRDTFHRRDIRSDALNLYEKRLQKISQLVTENVSSSTPTQSREEPNGSNREPGFLRSIEDMDADLLAIDSKEMEAVKQRFQKLGERKAAEIAPLLMERNKNASNLQELRKRREELEAQLRTLNEEIQDATAAQTEIDDRIEAVETKFELETSQFDKEHQEIIEQYRRKEQRDQIEAEFSQLEETINSIALKNSDVPSFKEKKVVCLRQHLQGILRYFASEVPCVKFMMARVQQAEVQLKKYANEAEGYKALGVGAVAKELVEKANTLQTHLSEDKQCLDTLKARDMQLLDNIQSMLADPSHADSLALLDENLIKEVHRHVDYIHTIYESIAISNGDSNGKAVNGSIGSQSKK